MKIKDMFEHDIDRNINGVIKVDQEDDGSVRQELNEYVVTDELRRHFKTLFDAYNRALDAPTDKVGVWISGSFGSGKSHFLKMLSYLFTNREAAGKTAIEYIAPRFEDDELADKAKRAAGVTTDAILFNMGIKSPLNKDGSAVARIFAKMYYESRGFYGADFKLARLERRIDDAGKTQEFRAAFEEVNHSPWVDGREDYDFNSDDVIEALSRTGVMSKDEAERWYEKSESNDFSIDQLTDDIAKYTKRREQECGGSYRMIFMADEMSQFIASDTELMLNLQSIVEALGTKCGGRVWVMVTGQQAIDQITKVKGSDFSKIQDRFNTRLSLSSSCADEVIRRRILAKNQAANDLLKAEYQERSAVLNNLYSFKDAAADLIGYEGAEDFASTYPFADYQFKLIQKIMDEMRNHGASGKNSSSAERSMLSGFQDSARCIEDKDQNALVPLWRFYNTISTSLEDYHRRVVLRAADAAQKGQGLEECDIPVLKLLFLILYVDKDMPANVDNLVTLMTDDVRTDRIVVREQISQSLERLVRQNYVARNGETYKYLTDEEQEIAQQISRVQPDATKITSKAAQIMFRQVFENAKVSVGKNVFDVEEYLDDTRYNSASGLALRVISGVDGAPIPSREDLLLSSSRGEAIVVLDSQQDYYDCLYQSACIEQYLNSRQADNRSEVVASILRGKQEERVALDKRAEDLMRQAVLHGTFYVYGSEYSPVKSASAKNMIEDCVRQLVSVTYNKLSLIDKNYDSDVQIKQILTAYTPAMNGQEPNAGAIEAVMRLLEARAAQHMQVTMSELLETYHAKPYGWAEIDIAAVVATLLAQKRARLLCAGQAIDLRDSKIIDYLRKAAKARQAVVEARQQLSRSAISKARQAVEELSGNHTLPLEEDSLAEACRGELEKRRDSLASLLSVKYQRNPDYPGYKEVVNAKNLIEGLLQSGRDAVDLIMAIAAKENELRDTAEDLEDIDEFFDSKVTVFDGACEIFKQMESERDYFEGASETLDALSVIGEAVKQPSLSLQFQKLSEANLQVRAAYKELLDQKRIAMLNSVEERYGDIEAYAQSKGIALARIGESRSARKDEVHNAATLTALDAVPVKLDRAQTTLYKMIDDAYEEANRPKPANTSVTVTTDHSGSAAPGSPNEPQSAPAPRRRVKSVSRSMVFRPLELNSQQQIDEYLDAARKELLRSLEGNDAIRLG